MLYFQSTYTHSQPNIPMPTQGSSHYTPGTTSSAMPTQGSSHYTPGVTASGQGQVNPNLTSPTSPTQPFGSVDNVLGPLRYPATSSQSEDAGIRVHVYPTTPSSGTRTAQPTPSAKNKQDNSCVVQ